MSDAENRNTILLTGATGVLGSELLGRLLSASDRRFSLLLRASADGNAKTRCGDLLTELYGSAAVPSLLERLHIIESDLTTPRWGLPEAEYETLTRSVNEIIHCAATTSLDTDWATARRANVDGTESILHFTDRAARNHPQFRRLHYVSTAYVAGATESIVAPSELNPEGTFRNAYERSKAVAESMVRASQRGGVPTTIYRPSIIVGDSETGHTSAFNVIYIPAKLLVNGFFRSFPALPQTVFDVVPVDYAAEAILALASSEHTADRCYHITSGFGRESTLREIIDFLFATFEKYWKLTSERKLSAKPPFVSPEQLAALAHTSLNAAVQSVRTVEKLVSEHLKVFRKTLPFVPYMLSNPRFDNSETVSMLGGYETPLFSSYAERLFKFCLDTNWGKTPLSGAGPRFVVGAPLRFSVV